MIIFYLFVVDVFAIGSAKTFDAEMMTSFRLFIDAARLGYPVGRGRGSVQGDVALAVLAV